MALAYARLVGAHETVRDEPETSALRTFFAGAVGLIPVDRPLLLAAGALAEPAIRTLDAIHVAAAVEANPLDAFVTYDERQAAAARLANPRTVQPGTEIPGRYELRLPRRRAS